MGGEYIIVFYKINKIFIKRFIKVSILNNFMLMQLKGIQ